MDQQQQPGLEAEKRCREGAWCGYAHARRVTASTCSLSMGHTRRAYSKHIQGVCQCGHAVKTSWFPPWPSGGHLHASYIPQSLFISFGCYKGLPRNVYTVTYLTDVYHAQVTPDNL